MDNEKIKELAQKFADKAFADADMSDFLTQEHKFCVTNACIAFGNFLMETHCIVEKSKVIGLWNEINNDAKTNIANGFPDYAEFNKLQLPPLEILFGKELFNDKEK